MDLTGKSPVDFKAIIPKPWHHSSPSQLKTFRRCARKWWFEKVAGLGGTSTPQAELGTRVHTVIENHLKALPVAPGTGPLWDEAIKIAKAGFHLLPPPGTVDPAQIEHAFSIPTPIVNVIGRIDLITTGRQAPWAILDHKTIGDLKWALTEEQLRTDVQCVVYLKALTQYVPDTVKAEFGHTYFQTGAPGSRQTRVLVERAETEEKWGRVLETLADQKKVSTATSQDDATPNPQACTDFGGCPFIGVCSVQQRMFNFAKATIPTGVDLSMDNSLIDKLVAAGYDRALVSKLNPEALKVLAAQTVDPVNPTTNQSANATSTPAPSTPATPATPAEMHWKQARTLLAQLRGETYEVTNEAVKAAKWTRGDIDAEIKRLQAGQAPAPIVPRITAATPTPTPSAPVAVTTNPVTRMDLWVVVGDARFPVAIVGNRATVEGQPFEVEKDGGSPAVLLQALKSIIVEKTGLTSVRFDQGTTSPVSTVPTASTSASASPSASLVPKENAKTTTTEPEKKDEPATMPKPRLTLKVDIANEKVPVAIYATEARWKDRVITFPAGTATTDVLRMVTESAPTPTPTPVTSPSTSPTTSASVPSASQEVGPVVTASPNQSASVPSASPFATTATPASSPSEPASTATVTTEPATNRNTVLYYDCSPSWGHERLENLLQPFQAEVERTRGAAYYGVIPFSEGPKAVAQELAKAIVTGALVLPEHLAINSFLPASGPAFEVLVRYAKGVVRGGK